MSSDNGLEGYLSRPRREVGDAEFDRMLADTRERIANARQDLPYKPDNALKLHEYSLYEAGLLQFLQTDSPAIVDSLRHAARSMVACCALVSRGEGPVTLDIMGDLLTMPRIIENNFLYLPNFIDGIYAALASRDGASILSLAQVDLQTLTTSTKFPHKYFIAMARALQGFCLGADWADGAAREALTQLNQGRMRDPEALDPLTNRYLICKCSPEMNLLANAGTDPERFNAALRRALEEHRFWCEYSPWQDSPQGCIALGPLALASAAAARGWPITVQSDYLPRFILLAENEAAKARDHEIFTPVEVPTAALSEVVPVGDFVARHPTGGFVLLHPTGNSDEDDETGFAEMLKQKGIFMANAREFLPSRPENARSLYRDSILEAGLLQRVQPDSPAIVDSLRRAARAMVACCALVSKGEGPVVLDIIGEPVTAKRFARNSQNFLYDVDDFTQALYAALASHDEASLASLTRVDLQTLTIAGMSQIDGFSFTWARALQGFCLGADWAADAYGEAAAQFKIERARPHMFYEAHCEYMDYKFAPVMDLLTATGTDPETFNAALRRALESHRYFFGTTQPNPGEDQSNDPEGFIALGPLAFTSVVAARGWPITVQSDYLPRCVWH